MTANPIPIVPLDTTSRHSRHYDFDSFSFSAPASTSSIVSPKSRSQYTATVAEVPSDSPPSPGGLARSQASLGDEDEAPRGRDASPRTLPYLHSPSISPVPLGRSRRSSHAKIIEAHHHLPSTAGGIPSDPVLYLPPLLSPLPHHVDKQEPHPHSHSHANAEVQKSIIASGGEQLTLTDFRTRLPNIDPASLALHQVLHHFRPVNNDYARTPYEAAFNWADLHLPTDVSREWYCVVFRSRRNPESSNLSLYTADREAHEEAVRNGGLIMYWYGVPDSVDGSNMATCIWQSRRHAINAISGPKHRVAMMQAAGAYAVYDLERWVLRKVKGETGLSLTAWKGGEVGW